MNSVFILLSIYLLLEAVSWTLAFQTKLTYLHDQGGLLNYIGKVVRTMLIPELFTLVIIIFLINCWHNWLKLKAVKNDWRSIGRYELKFLPILALSFWLFDPVTQSVRFLLSEKYSDYSFAKYQHTYIGDTYSWKMYFIYLLPVLLIGYIALNVSLLTDYMKQRREAQELAEAEAARASQEALALYATFTPKPTTPSPYLSYLKGKNNLGELDFPVNDAYYFTIEDRFYYAELVKGRYLVAKTLNELEAELDPTQFFRIKRDYIVNRQAVLNYAYWENGKYIVRLNTPDQYNIIVPRARMHEFREWLQGRYVDNPEHANTPLL
ncbi:hypothetical protein GCM10028773_62370 [Spirosoma koreense]